MATLNIELTEHNQRRVLELAHQSGKSPSDVVNEAVGRYACATNGEIKHWQEALLAAEGMWRDHDVPPDPDALRKEWDRRSVQPGSVQPTTESRDGMTGSGGH